MQSQQQVATANNLNRNHVLMAPPPYPVQGQCTHSCPYHCGQFFQPPLGYSNLPPIQPIHTQPPYHPPSASYPLPNAAPLSSSGLPYSAPVVAPPASGSTSSTPTNSSLYNRSVRPKRRSHGVMTIGDIIDRLSLFDAAKGRGLSKNRACASIEISKGTVGTYQMRVNEARRYGIELSEFRDFKWRDFRQVFRMTVSQSGVVTEEGPPSKSSTSASEAGSNKLSSTATTSGSDGDLLDKKLSERSDSLLDESIQLSIADHLLGPHILSQLKLSLEPHRLNLHHLVNPPSSPTNSAQPLTYPSTPTPTSSTPSITALNTLSITGESTVVNPGQPSSHPTPTRSSASKKRRRSTTMNLAVENGHIFDDEEDVVDSDAGVGTDLDSVDDDSDYVDEEVTSKATSTLLHSSTTTSLPHAPTNRTTLPVQPIPLASTDTAVNAIESIKPHKLESALVSELLKVEPIVTHAPLKDDGSHDPSVPKVTPSSSDVPTCSSASTPISNGNVASSFQPFHHSSFHPPPPPPPRPPQPMPPPHHAMHHTHSHPLPPQSSGVTHTPFSIPSHSFHYPMTQPNPIPWQHSHPLQPHPHAIPHQPTPPPPPPPPPPHFIPYPSVSPSFHPSYPPLHPSHTPVSFATRTINTPQTTHTHTMMLPPSMRASMMPSSSHTHTQILTHLSPHPSPLIHSNSSSTHLLSSAFAPASLAPIKLESN